MKVSPQMSDVRRANLRRLVSDRFDGRYVDCAKATGLNRNIIALYLTTNLDIRRAIGERQARRIEETLGLPTMWMDSERGATDDKVTTVNVVDLQTMAASSVERVTLLREAFLRGIEQPTSLDNLKALRAVGSEMAPAIKAGDLMLVDTGVADFSSAGVYVLTQGAFVFVRRVRPLLTGGYRISADAETETIDAKPGEFTPSGKVVGVMRLSQV